MRYAGLFLATFEQTESIRAATTQKRNNQIISIPVLWMMEHYRNFIKIISNMNFYHSR